MGNLIALLTALLPEFLHLLRLYSVLPKDAQADLVEQFKKKAIEFNQAMEKLKNEKDPSDLSRLLSGR